MLAITALGRWKHKEPQVQGHLWLHEELDLRPHKTWKKARMDSCFLIKYLGPRNNYNMAKRNTDFRARLPGFTILALKHTSHVILGN